MGVMGGLIAWGYTRYEDFDRWMLIRWGFAYAIGLFLLGALRAALVGSSLAEEYVGRRSWLSFAFVVFIAVCIVSILHPVDCVLAGRDDP